MVMLFCVSPGLNVTLPLAFWKSEPALALPEDVNHCTVAATLLGLLSVSVKTAGVVPLLPSVTRMSLPEIDGGGSLSTIVTVATDGLASAAPAVGFDSETVKLSLPS